MTCLGRVVGILAFAVGWACVGTPLWAARQPAPGPTRALQRLAEKQGHPGAAARDLRNLGHEVPEEIEAAAAGIKPDALRRAMEQKGPLAARLETARGRKLSADQGQRIAAAEREHARHLESFRTKFLQDVATITGLPEAVVRKPLARDQGAPAAEQRTVSELEKLLGRRLSAGEADRVAAARDAFRAAARSQRTALAERVGQIAGVPSSIALELIRQTPRVDKPPVPMAPSSRRSPERTGAKATAPA